MQNHSKVPKAVLPPLPVDYVDDFDDDDAFIDAFLAKTVVKPADHAECGIINEVACRDLVPYVGGVLIVEGNKSRESENNSPPQRRLSPSSSSSSSDSSSCSYYESDSSPTLKSFVDGKTLGDAMKIFYSTTSGNFFYF